MTIGANGFNAAPNAIIHQNNYGTQYIQKRNTVHEQVGG